MTASDYHYSQTIAGVNGDYSYSGKSKNIDAQLSRVLHHNSVQKTTLTFDVSSRGQRNYINDVEAEVQRRHTSAWQLGLQHHHSIDSATIDAGISYQRGTRWFGAQPAQEEAYGEATALAKIIQVNAQLNLPMSEILTYNMQYQLQSSSTPLTSQDMFSIGSRWSVRGFDGERSLSASHGWYVRNTLSWLLPVPAQTFYLGVDYGEVGGAGSEYLVGQHLAGGVAGFRGQVWRASYDVFGGTPLSKPDGFKTDPVTFGFNLYWSY